MTQSRHGSKMSHSSQQLTSSTENCSLSELENMCYVAAAGYAYLSLLY